MAQDGNSMADTGRMRVVASETARMLADRIYGFLQTEEMVVSTEDLGMGIFGVTVHGPDDEEIAISLVVQPTQ